MTRSGWEPQALTHDPESVSSISVAAGGSASHPELNSEGNEDAQSPAGRGRSAAGGVRPDPKLGSDGTGRNVPVTASSLSPRQRHSNDFVRSPEVQCEGKHGYRSKAEAKRYARRAEHRLGRLVAYRCPHCELFHLGHRS